MKKIKILIITFLLIALTISFSNASYSDLTMSVIEEPITTINFGTKSVLERSVISKDLENKEITIQLKITNSEENLKPTGEIMLVVDNSKSMLEQVTDTQTRQDLVLESAKTLITNLLEDNSKLQIGVVSFSTNSDISKEGTIEDAQIVSELTNNVEHLISSVSNIQYNGPRTNLDAGISLAKQYFTNETDSAHKYIIILTDGVPNVAVDYDNKYFSDDVISKTKANLQSLSTITDNVYVMLTGIINGDFVASPSTKSYNEIITEIFGTTDTPTIGNFYYITDDKIEDTIKSNIYINLLPISQSYTNLKITETFTKEIVENFDFSYVKEPNYGTISDKINLDTDSIIWDIPELKSGETAIVQYKLKLKENYNDDILDKVLDTNSNLELTYTDFSDNTDTKNSDVTPKIKLTEPEDPKPEVYPNAGKNTLLFGIVISLVLSILLGLKNFKK